MIFSILLVVFIVLPIVELALLIKVGEHIGAVFTVGLVVLTGVVGVSLARLEGMRILWHIRQDLEEGRVPAPAVVDGLLIIVAGALLVTPGFLTDATGFLLLVPRFRMYVRSAIRRYLDQRVHADVIDVTYWE